MGVPTLKVEGINTHKNITYKVVNKNVFIGDKKLTFFVPTNDPLSRQSLGKYLQVLEMLPDRF